MQSKQQFNMQEECQNYQVDIPLQYRSSFDTNALLGRENFKRLERYMLDIDTKLELPVQLNEIDPDYNIQRYSNLDSSRTDSQCFPTEVSDKNTTFVTPPTNIRLTNSCPPIKSAINTDTGNNVATKPKKMTIKYKNLRQYLKTIKTPKGPCDIEKEKKRMFQEKLTAITFGSTNLKFCTTNSPYNSRKIRFHTIDTLGDTRKTTPNNDAGTKKQKIIIQKYKPSNILKIPSLNHSLERSNNSSVPCNIGNIYDITQSTIYRKLSQTPIIPENKRVPAVIPKHKSRAVYPS